MKARHPDALVVLLRAARRPRSRPSACAGGATTRPRSARASQTGAEEERLGRALTPFVVVNDDVDRAVAEVAGILEAHRRCSGAGPSPACRFPWRSLMPQRRITLMDPPIEDLLDKVDSKFTLVALSAKRARQINSYYNQLGEGLGMVVPPQVASVSGKPLTIAFEEVAAGKATYHRIEPGEEAGRGRASRCDGRPPAYRCARSVPGASDRRDAGRGRAPPRVTVDARRAVRAPEAGE